jgi:hypothetical protein
MKMSCESIDAYDLAISKEKKRYDPIIFYVKHSISMHLLLRWKFYHASDALFIQLYEIEVV